MAFERSRGKNICWRRVNLGPDLLLARTVVLAFVFVVGLSGCSQFFKQVATLGLVPPGESLDPEPSKPTLLQVTSMGGSISLAAPMAVNGKVVFVGGDYRSGNELWVHDPVGASTVMLKDIYPGSLSSEPQSFYVTNSLIYFTAKDDTGFQVWRTDGTAVGTIRLTNHPQDPFSKYRTFVAMGTSVLFAANDGVAGIELWKTDGTVAGTSMIKDINPGATSAFFSFVNTLNGVPMGGRYYFVANNGTNGSELWSTDGTAAGTRMDADVVVGAVGSSIGNLMAFGTNIVFTADDGVSGRELYISDGTPEGTSLLKDIRVGSSGSNPQEFFVHGSKLYFIARQLNYSLWESDGTSVGTIRVSNDMEVQFGNYTYQIVGDHVFLNALNTVTSNYGAHAINLVSRAVTFMAASSLFAVSGFTMTRGQVLGGNLIIPVNNPTSGTELWTIDTTTLARSMIAEVNSGAASGVTGMFGVKDGKVIFLGNDGVTGNELWSTDGTAPGTLLFKDTFAGTTSSMYGSPSRVSSGFAANDRIYFPVASPGGFPRIWVTDGTTLGTNMIVDSPAIWENSQSFGTERYPIGLIGGKILLKNFDATYGHELWTFDPVANAVAILKDISIIAGVSIEHLFYSTWFNGRYLFNAKDPVQGESLWLTDGTTAGTTFLIATNATSTGDVQPIGVAGGRAIFGSYDTVNGQEVWSTDGTLGGTIMTGDLSPGLAGTFLCSGSGIEFNGFLFFCAQSLATGSELYKTNGLLGGTTLVKEIYVGAGSGTPSLKGIVHGGFLYFAATDGILGTELWRTDGTEVGTALVKDIAVGAPSAISTGLNAFLPVDGGFIFQADDGIHGLELWFSDGTDTGTQMITEIRSGTGNPNFSTLVDLKVPGLNKYFFFADDGMRGAEPFVTDGTAAGTFSLGDLNSGATGSAGSAAALGVLPGKIYFTADDGVHGAETWVSDGTVPGTNLYAETIAGAAAQPIRGTVVIGGEVFIFAVTGIGAAEIFKIVPPAISSSHQ